MKKTAEKVDKGFELFYAKLSWRRKFIRTLWMLPVALCILIRCVRVPEHSIYLPVSAFALLVVWLWQAAYTYRKWSAERRRRD